MDDRCRGYPRSPPLPETCAPSPWAWQAAGMRPAPTNPAVDCGEGLRDVDCADTEDLRRTHGQRQGMTASEKGGVRHPLSTRVVIAVRRTELLPGVEQRLPASTSKP